MKVEFLLGLFISCFLCVSTNDHIPLSSSSQCVSVSGAVMDLCSPPPTETFQDGVHEKQGDKIWSFMTSQQWLGLNIDPLINVAYDSVMGCS